MKKTFFVILMVFLAIVVSIYMNYKQGMLRETEANKFNSDFEFFNKEAILGTDITTIINKAIDNNEKFNIPKDENGLYIPDDENSVEIYINMIINETTYPMENLKSRGLDEFTKYFGQVEFKCTDVKYHEKTGKIAEMSFASTEY